MAVSPTSWLGSWKAAETLVAPGSRPADQLSDVASNLITRAGAIDALLHEAGKSSRALNDIREGADLVYLVGEDCLRRRRGHDRDRSCLGGSRGLEQS